MTLEEQLEDLDNFDRVVAEADPDDDIPDNPSEDVEVDKAEDEVIPDEKPAVAEEEEAAAEEAAEPLVIESKSEAVKDDSASIIEDLRRQIEELHGTVLDLKSHKPEGKASEKTDVSDAKSPDNDGKSFTMEAVDFLADYDIDDVGGDPKVFNEVLNKAVTHAVAQAIAQVNQTLTGVQQTVRTLPTELMQKTKQEILLDRKIDAFYQANEDLANVRRTVGAVAAEIADKDPNLSVDDLFEKAAKKTRELLKLPVPKKSKSSKGEFDDPAFVAKTSGRRTKEKVTNLQAQIDEL
jgi:hypothetical protein